MFRCRKKADPRDAQDQVAEAQEAVHHVRERDKKVQAETNEIMSVVREIRDFQRRNNFARAIRHALGGGSG